ncbi:Trp biosynthesis-associated membrane protein [Kocuria atrinae]|uniref:Trp biosynthesis-associated membrane protein n=1 Tax=Kocuria atrinae TaxID=592377 RepID=UPI0021D4652B|nr:Trp biosynthesis-associated membrane protein [Kocuria atrinae]
MVVSLSGIGAIFAVLAVTADPENAARGTVGTQTGAVGTGGEFALTVFPWLAVVAAAGLILCGVWLVLVARNARKKSGQRYDREALAGNKAASSEEKVTTEHSDDIDAWDAFTRGEDPTRGP